jgi:hypothetical protein
VSTEPETEKAASQSHTCPQCGGQMKFDAAQGAPACPFCGHVMHTAETTETVEDHDLVTALRDTKSKAKGFGVQVKALKCQACGATNNVAPNVTSTHCPFCGSNQVVEQQPDPNMIRPESLIPFKVDEGRANTLFIKWLGSGLFHPGDLKRYGGAQKLDGVYLPFWTFDADAYSRWRAESGDYYYETQTVTVTRDGKQVQETQQVQKVRWYPSSGQRRGRYDDVLVYATESIDVKMINKIYPYHTQELAPYAPSYLSGWAAEAYSIELERAWQLGKDIIQSKEYDECRRDVPGDTHRNLRVNTALSNLTYKHVLLPVWLASYRYNEKVYRFMINGQTGEVQGQKPISWIKVAIAVAIAIAIIVVIVLLVRSGQSDAGSGWLMYEYALASLGIL